MSYFVLLCFYLSFLYVVLASLRMGVSKALYTMYSLEPKEVRWGHLLHDKRLQGTFQVYSQSPIHALPAID